MRYRLNSKITKCNIQIIWNCNYLIKVSSYQSTVALQRWPGLQHPNVRAHIVCYRPQKCHDLNSCIFKWKIQLWSKSSQNYFINKYTIETFRNPESSTVCKIIFTKVKLFLFSISIQGVFFAVCMAMLMLSLIKSILVVKLLCHSEKEVKQMSISACLLDKYGSAGHIFSESALTSIKTLDCINPSGGKLPTQRQILKKSCWQSIPECVVALCFCLPLTGTWF